MSTELAPCVPTWVMMEREADMQVDARTMKSVVFLGEPAGNGFRADGTAFFLSVTEEDAKEFVYLVSCRHVVRPFTDREQTEPDNSSIWIRVNRKRSSPRLYETKRSEWICHEDRFIDVCVFPCNLSWWEGEDDVDVGVVSASREILTPEKERQQGELRVGDPLFMPSVFVGRVGSRRNIPVLRLASVAALAEEPVEWGSRRRPAYLIETRSLGGTSGSPVFLHTAAIGRFIGDGSEAWADVWQNADTGEYELPYFLIGMMQGTHGGQYASDFATDPEDERVVPTDADFNAGIGIVIRYQEILEVLNRDELKAARMATVKQSKKDSGYRPAAAPARGPPTKGENPQHKEDFSRLLDAAVKGPQSGDQT